MNVPIHSSPLERAFNTLRPHSERKQALQAFRKLKVDLIHEFDKHTVGLDYKHHFLPARSRESLVNHHVLRQLLPRSESAHLQWLFKEASTTLLVTILSLDDLDDVEDALLAFQKHETSDKYLPIPDMTATSTKDACRRIGIGNINGSDQSSALHESNSGACQHRRVYEAFHSRCWSLSTVRRFYHEQWSFLVQEFDTKVFEYDVENHRLLPFLVNENQNRHEGGFSDVVQVQMLSDYLREDDNDLPNQTSKRDSEIPVAIKILRPLGQKYYDIQKEWRKEAYAYRRLNSFRHKHIIRGIGAFRQAGKHHLLLEWANGGSLENFWTKNSRPQLTASRVLEALEQMRGLADALNVLHNTKNSRAQRNSLSISRTEAPFSPHGDVVSTMSPSILEPPINVSVTDVEQQSEPVDLNWRHGDIKPSNILRFVDYEDPNSWLGTLKLADLGSAKHHESETQLRGTAEVSFYHTMKYEPPDAYIDLGSQMVSRLYDIWSLGCVFLEFVSWLVSQGLVQVGTTIIADKFMPEDTPFWDRTGPNGATVSQSASMLMEALRRYSTLCKDGSALGDLLKLVQEKMLVVELPPTSKEYIKGYRANAKHVLDEVANIVHRARVEPSYLFPEQPQLEKSPDRTNENFEISDSTSTTPNSTKAALARTVPKVLPTQVQGYVETHQPLHKRFRSESFSGPSLDHKGDTRGDVTQLRYPKLNHITQMRSKMTGQYEHTLHGTWHYENDDAFAESTLDKVFDKKVRSKVYPASTLELCEVCTNFSPASPSSFGSRTLSLLRGTSEECDLCEYIYHRAQEAGLLSSHKISLSRDGGVIWINNRPDTRMRVCRSPGTKQALLGNENAIPIGLPKLNRTAISQHGNVMQQWLKDCDKHESCASPVRLGYCPKRLVYLGNGEQERCRLIETKSLGSACYSLKYVAFSHPWGMPKYHQHFKSTKFNYLDFLSGIAFEKLPVNYQDAIRVCRAINIEYLWIDSICILQAATGDMGDFKDEAAFIQDIFSSAYCVIAASSAQGTSSGFLNPRKQPQVLALPMNSSNHTEDGSYYISDLLDDFQTDVLDGPLNERGWVMQERALARRTIFFTANQVYIECSQGVRCETLSKLRCDRAAFLGDSKFPAYGMSHKPGAQLYLITALYEHYSALKFTEYIDKPVAISGMEQRLTQKYGIRSGAGVFQQLSGKWLLWERAKGVDSLSRISFPDNKHSHKPPSWSFMGYIGAITYINVPYSNIIWNNQIRLILSGDSKRMWLYADKPLEMQSRILTLGDEAASKILAVNSPVKTHTERAQNNIYITYDNQETNTELIKTFVIIGTFKLGASIGVRHYVLAVTPTKVASGGKMYERVGAGWLPEWLLDTATETHVFFSIA